MKHLVIGLAAGAGVVAGAWYFFTRPKHEGARPAAEHGDPAPVDPQIVIGGLAAPLGTSGGPPTGWTGSWGYSLPPTKAVYGDTVKEMPLPTIDLEWVS